MNIPHHNHRVSRPELPTIEQPIIVGFDMNELGVFTDATLRGECAALVIRGAQYDNLDKKILDPIKEEFGLGVAATVEFDRQPIRDLDSYKPGQRETFHLDTGDAINRKLRLEFPYALTISHTVKGTGKFLVAASSGRVRAWTIEDYNREMMRVNNDPKLLQEIRKDTWLGLNKQLSLEYKGLRGPVGAIHLGEGDVAIIPQGGDASVSPSWHSIVTQRDARRSRSHHLRKK